jgi:hypothetical protein
MINDIKTMLKNATAVAALAVVASAAACTDDSTAAGCPAGCPAGCAPAAGDSQSPPQGTPAAIDAWITAASYKGAGWKCETASHDGRSPSPHGKNRICNNTKLTATAAGAKYPFGAASVKELFAADGTTIVGYATGIKLYDGASDGSKWYWYEKMNGGVAFNGIGKKDNTDVCSGCHVGAGTDAGHSGRDFVYTQVP